MATALATLMSKPATSLVGNFTSPVARLERLEAALGAGAPRIFIKRDDLLPFALGGNKVRKLQMLAADATRAGATALITCGAVQSNHARVTAAAGAVLGLSVILVLSGERPDPPAGNYLRDMLFGAEIRVVPRREDRDPAMAEAAEDVRRAGGVPFVIPMGGSTPLGVMGVARAVAELSADRLKPDVIVCASSSGGTQAGLMAGCTLFGLPSRVLGISADLPADELKAVVSGLLDRTAVSLGSPAGSLAGAHGVEVDDGQVGAGYGAPTDAADEAVRLLARREGILLDSVYTSKAMAGLIAHVRAGQFSSGQTVLFWHTGGLVG
jgi:1-aminocyclopropane-1-carboxylate deaminase/D-cysteine desulfhydrase-like pyridoxal-dependent ACC family enzyme